MCLVSCCLLYKKDDHQLPLLADYLVNIFWLWNDSPLQPIQERLKKNGSAWDFTQDNKELFTIPIFFFSPWQKEITFSRPCKEVIGTELIMVSWSLTGSLFVHPWLHVSGHCCPLYRWTFLSFMSGPVPSPQCNINSNHRRSKPSTRLLPLTALSRAFSYLSSSLDYFLHWKKYGFPPQKTSTLVR